MDLQVKNQQEVIDVRWKPANGKKCHYGDKHCDHLTFLLLDTLLLFLDVHSRRLPFPQMQHNFGIKHGHSYQRNQV